MLAGGVALYSLKEVVRYFTEGNLQRKRINLENIYPIYTRVFKAAKIFIGSYTTPVFQSESLKVKEEDIIAEFKKDKIFIKTYEEDINFRYLVNLNKHIDKMRGFKKDFNNEFSSNQFCFKGKFVEKTIAIDKVMTEEIEYLQKMVNYCSDNHIKNVEEVIITDEYRQKIKIYEKYLDDFNREFNKRFKI